MSGAPTALISRPLRRGFCVSAGSRGRDEALDSAVVRPRETGAKPGGPGDGHGGGAEGGRGGLRVRGSDGGAAVARELVRVGALGGDAYAAALAVEEQRKVEEERAMRRSLGSNGGLPTMEELEKAIGL